MIKAKYIIFGLQFDRKDFYIPFSRPSNQNKMIKVRSFSLELWEIRSVGLTG